MDLIHSNMYFVIPALVVLGTILKKTSKVPDWCIPFVLLVAACGAGLAVVGLNADGVVQGVLTAGVAVLGHQLYKQTINAKGGDLGTDDEEQGGESDDSTEAK